MSHSRRLDAATLSSLRQRAPLVDVVAGRVALKRSGRLLVGCCPFHRERTPSFTVYADEQRFHCFGCGARGDAFEFLMRSDGLTFPEAVARLAGGDILAAPSRPGTPPPPGPPPKALRGSPTLDRLWDGARPLAGSPAETYLKARCGRVPHDADLRFLPATDRHPHPAMLALVTDFATGERLSLHFTLLAADGSGKAAVDKPKRLLAGHAKSGGVIRLTHDAEVTQGLGLAEGIETAISVMAHGWSPVWAAVDAGNMKGLPVLDGCSLCVFADCDRAGLAAAHALVRRWREAGRAAWVVAASGAGSDWNDLQQGAA